MHADWPEPAELPDELPPVMPFDYSLLPSSFRDWIRDIAERLQCPPDYPAIAAMIAAATVVGRKVGVRPKRQDDWTVVPNLWGIAVGPPSMMKTPALQEPLNPLKQLEITRKREFEEAMKEYEAQKLVAEQQRLATKAEIRSKLKSDEAGATAVARDAIDADAKEPARRRYLLNDTTVEKVGEILNQNPNGVLCYRDELMGFLRSLDRDGQEGARSFYLEAWDGRGRFTYDRIGRGTVDIDCAIVSIIGSIQPGPLSQYLRGAIGGGVGADGLMQRFQLAVYPDIPATWQNVDRWPDTEAKHRAYEVIYSLDQLAASDISATEDDESLPYLRFERGAQKRFDHWRSDLELRLRAGQDHEVIVAHLAKYRSLIPSIALLSHLIDGGRGKIGVEHIERAIAWGEYLESHARRIYAIAVTPGASEANMLAKRIRDGSLKDEFSLRDVYRKKWLGLSTRDSAERATAVLLDLDWIRRVDEPTGGHPRTTFAINPHVYRSTSAAITAGAS